MIHVPSIVYVPSVPGWYNIAQPNCLESESAVSLVHFVTS